MTVESGTVFDLRTSSAYRIGDGGLLRRVELLCRLTRLRSQLVTVLLFTWFPIVVLGLVREYSTGQPEAMIYDPAIHVRLLVAIPVFLVIDDLFPTVCGYVISLLMAQKFVPAEQQYRLERVLRSGVRLADSTLPEALLAVGCMGLGVSSLLGFMTIAGIDLRNPSPAQTWYALTDLPLFQFLLWRSLWRWAIWVRILFGISRITLDLVPTHPDKRGGIRFLCMPSVGYCAGLLFAISSVLCAEWGGRFTLGATIGGFAPLLLAFGTIGVLIAFGPLFLFVLPLYRARRYGLAEVGGIATAAGRRFRDQCLDTTLERDRVDVHALSAVEQTYRETVYELRVVLFDRRDLMLLLLATLAPLLPVMLLYVPFEDWRALAGAAIGFKP
jgi:hypothetical protein